MAPELLEEKPYDHMADLWSLGCIIYETMAGAPPFSATALLRLMQLIKNTNVCWPSFLSSDCLSFLQGLLQKNPSNRLSWTAILEHPFVCGQITIVDEPAAASSPFTHPLSQSQCLAKERQLNHLTNIAINQKTTPCTQQISHDIHRGANNEWAVGDITTSQDSVHAILQSDIENIETDAEDAMSLYKGNIAPVPPTAANLVPPIGHNVADLCFVSGNSNLIVTNYNDNFQQVQRPGDLSVSHMRLSRNKELEKRKLSQNLENFSVRLGKGQLTNSRSGAGDKVVKESVKLAPEAAQSQSCSESS